MRVFYLTILLFFIASVLGCGAKDPSGYAAQATGALQNKNYAQALVYASRHSKNALLKLTDEYFSTLGKTSTCAELSRATKMIHDEYLSYEAAGNITEAKITKQAHRRLANTKFDFCQ